jgi:hypothetical protein
LLSGGASRNISAINMRHLEIVMVLSEENITEYIP